MVASFPSVQQPSNNRKDVNIVYNGIYVKCLAYILIEINLVLIYR